MSDTIITPPRTFSVNSFNDFLREQTIETIHTDRRFLNLPDSEDTGSVQGTILWKSGYNEESEGYVSYNMSILDCHKRIELNFDGTTKEHRENSLNKIDNLIEFMQEYKEGLIKAFDVENKIMVLEKKRKEADKLKEEQAKEKLKEEQDG